MDKLAIFNESQATFAMKLSFANNYKNFQLKKAVDIAELQLTLIELEHLPTGAQVLHLANSDEENVFNISFRTYPSCSNGVAHVLEHIVLCGSEKFPIKDPFFSMTRRSLNTFMNAFTGPDFTCYPAASQIKADFYNLLEVYLDAVFHPRLREISFLQEGHHLEFAKPKDPLSALKIKGVVYNEMKGSMANPDHRLEESLFESLFSDLSYRFNSGGNPTDIRNLTYNDLKTFHEKFYHPSQALFYFYGNLPLEGHLDFLEEKVLKGVIKNPPLTPQPIQKRLQAPICKTHYYPFTQKEEIKEKTLIAWGWLTLPGADEAEILALSVIDMALMGTDAAPLRHALLQSNLCKQVDTSLEEELSEIPFILVCKGCPEDAADKLEKLLRENLAKIAEEGIPSHLIVGAIHQLEMSKKEITGTSTPYGLSLFFRSGLVKQQGKSAEEELKIHSLFKKLHDLLKDPLYLSQLIRNHLLNNPHCVRLVMHPDATLAAKELQEEEEYLKIMQQKLKEEDKQKILLQAQALKKYQEEKEDLNLLPELALSDIPPHCKDFPLKKESSKALTLYSHDCFTNEILYTDLFFNLPELPEEDLSYLRLFSLLIPELGCGGRDYKENLDFLFQHTGGVSCELDFFLSAEDPQRGDPALSFRGKGLYHKTDKLFTFFQELLGPIDFQDSARIQDLLKQHFEEMETSFQRSPLRYALNMATGSFSKPLRINNLWYGLDYFEKLKEVKAQFDIDPQILQKKLEELKERCLSLQGPDLVISATYDKVEELQKKGFYGLNTLKEKPFKPWKNEIQLPPPLSQGRIITSPVAFNVLAFPTLPYTHPESPALSIASQIMENKMLHLRIREQGGAYGAGATHAATWGYFYFHSYRDPHIKATYEAIYEAVDELTRGNFNEEDLLEAKFSLLQVLDDPRAPGSRGGTAYAWMRSHRTKEKREKYRQELLKMDKEEIVHVAKTRILPKLPDAVRVSFASRELLEKENLAMGDKALPLYEI